MERQEKIHDHNPTSKTFWLRIIKIAALVIMLKITMPHVIEDFSINIIVYAFIAVIAGFLLGKYTCVIHERKGLWVTLGVFITLNIFHSIIDGVILAQVGYTENVQLVLLHEAVRQPALYVVCLAMISPFFKIRKNQLFVCAVLVTGTWGIGTMVGYFLFDNMIKNIDGAHHLTNIMLFVFIGDIIHHLLDELWHNH